MDRRPPKVLPVPNLDFLEPLYYHFADEGKEYLRGEILRRSLENQSGLGWPDFSETELRQDFRKRRTGQIGFRSDSAYRFSIEDIISPIYSNDFSFPYPSLDIRPV